MHIVAVGLNHRTAPVEVRERLAFSPRQLRQALAELRTCEACKGCIILHTCNRTEIYAAVTQPEQGIGAILAFLGRKCGFAAEELRPYLYTYSDYDAVGHLFRVAAGLDSMIVGETQILGQVREAYEVAREEGMSNGVLNTLFQQAISAGKRVRTETRIDQNAVSVSYAAVELAKMAMEGLEGRTVLVVGAGKMSTLAAEYLVANGVSTVLVSNRSYEKAAELAVRLNGQAVPFEELYASLAKADIVLSCTSAPHYVIRREGVEAVLTSRGGRPLILIDIAVPRDVEPAVAELPGVSLYDIDDLEQVVEDNLARRRELAKVAENIIAEEINSFLTWLSTLSVVPTIVALKERGERIKQAELQRAFNRLGSVGPREKKIITALANSIVNQLLHDPVVNLKHYATAHEGHHYAEILQKLFGLEVKVEEALQTRRDQGREQKGEDAQKKEKAVQPHCGHAAEGRSGR